MQSEALSFESLGPGVLFAGRYELLRELGQGGFAKVFLARDTLLVDELFCALKVLNPTIAQDLNHLRRFQRELILARRVMHKNVCKLFDVGQAGKLSYITMEYVAGEDLDTMLGSGYPFQLREALTICHQIACGLAAAHEAGIVHRDLKPHNVLITADGTAKVLDFGIARSADATPMTLSGTMMGTPAYMSPEQCRGEPGDERSDIYSLGVLMYRLFTGKPPFKADKPMGVLFLHVSQAPRPPIELNLELPEPVNAMILRCLAKSPAERFPSARAVAKEIDAVLLLDLDSGLDALPDASASLFGLSSIQQTARTSPLPGELEPAPSASIATSPTLPTPDPASAFASVAAEDAGAGRETTPQSMADRLSNQTASTRQDASTPQVPLAAIPVTDRANEPLDEPAHKAWRRFIGVAATVVLVAIGGTTAAYWSTLRPESLPNATGPEPRSSQPATPGVRTAQPESSGSTAPATSDGFGMAPTTPTSVAVATAAPELPVGDVDSALDTSDSSAPSLDPLLSPAPAPTLLPDPEAIVDELDGWLKSSAIASVADRIVLLAESVSIEPGARREAGIPGQVSSATSNGTAPLSSSRSVVSAEPPGIEPTPLSFPSVSPQSNETSNDSARHRAFATAAAAVTADRADSAGAVTADRAYSAGAVTADRADAAATVTGDRAQTAPAPSASAPSAPAPSASAPSAPTAPSSPASTAPSLPASAPLGKPASIPTAATRVAPRATPAVRPTRLPKAAPPTPTVVPIVQATGSILIQNLPDDSELCIDNVPTAATRHGSAHSINSIPTGTHQFRASSRSKGLASTTLQIESGPNPTLRLQAWTWMPPRYSLRLSSQDGGHVDLDKPLTAMDEITLPWGEAIKITVAPAQLSLSLRRGDGRVHQWGCRWAEVQQCKAPPRLDCGVMPLPR